METIVNSLAGGLSGLLPGNLGLDGSIPALSSFMRWCVGLAAGEDALGEIGTVPQWVLSAGGMEFRINVIPLAMTWLIMAFLMIVAWLGGRNLKEKPDGFQTIMELIVGGFRDLCRDSLGKRGRIYMPLVTTLFLFIVLSNTIGIFPGLEEPTKDMNTPMAFAIIVFFVVHFSGFYFKGFRYFIEFFEPMIEIGPIKIPNLFMFALNIVGEIGKVISHAFRLFGNILGGSIIILVISYLIQYFLLPVALQGILGLGIGVIQAFVFAMLALTYVAVAIVED
jgi:F-type H+-transporting ATPase subunit a